MARIDLKEQLLRRIDALQALLDHGQPLPGNASPPTSMAQARSWVVPELGIETIASKSSTNQKKHKGNDALLKALQDLSKLTDRCLVLTRTKKRAPKPKPEIETKKLSIENYELRTREVGLSNRLHEVEHELDTLKKRFEDQRLLLAKSTELVAGLRRKLNEVASENSGRPHLSLTKNEPD